MLLLILADAKSPTVVGLTAVTLMPSRLAPLLLNKPTWSASKKSNHSKVRLTLRSERLQSTLPQLKIVSPTGKEKRRSKSLSMLCGLNGSPNKRTLTWRLTVWKPSSNISFGIINQRTTNITAASTVSGSAPSKTPSARNTALQLQVVNPTRSASRKPTATSATKWDPSAMITGWLMAPSLRSRLISVQKLLSRQQIPAPRTPKQNPLIRKLKANTGLQPQSFRTSNGQLRRLPSPKRILLQVSRTLRG